MPFYISQIIIPNCDYKRFEEIALANSHCRMNLIQGTLEIMPPVSNDTDQRKANIICDVVIWCRANANLVGHFGASRGCYTLSNTVNDSKPTILGPDASIVLSTRWNALSDDKQKSYPPVVPNFVVELRSQSQSPQDFHKKMLLWMNGGVEEGIAIDRYANPREVRIYTFNPNTNSVEWQTLTNPTHVASQVLTGFDFEENLEGILGIGTA
ncbi:11190_t:CDS:2 [Scutellospora calospora]|uniref:11190_t:CDS:1 n=1 Tax=Scutellospora calospora TaxID=85575 RepID=A0ACA9JTX6_9GLOM|nr:11190_t:CDS:2 [Scutellospora calospora]